MKRYLKVIALVLVAALMVCSLAGCEKSLDKVIIGSWQSPDPDNRATIEFREDQTVTFDFGSITIFGVKLNSAVNGTYKLDMEKEPAQIEIVPKLPLSGLGLNLTMTFDVTYEEKVLTLKNSDMNLEFSMIKSEDTTQTPSETAE